MSANKRTAVIIAFYLLAMGIAGNDDYEQALMVERHVCEVNPKPEFCNR